MMINGHDFTTDEKKVSEYLQTILPDLANLADPVEFIITSHQAMRARIVNLEAALSYEKGLNEGLLQSVDKLKIERYNEAAEKDLET